MSLGGELVKDNYVELARETLESYVKTGKIIKVPDNISKEMMGKKAGVFISLKMNGDLRGCIGTIMPTTGSIAEEIIQNAISAGSQDPRFYPVQAHELSQLTYSVDVLTEAEPIDSYDKLDVKEYGVIVRAGRRSGLLLPNLEGINTVEEQVMIALKKAGIRLEEPFEMERFEVIRHKE
jgi:AmmeMemoRadiSam system protein A